MKQAIFVLGMTERTGTNFVANLLTLHPDCSALESLREDHLVKYADQLARYVDSVSSRWNPAWGLIEPEQGRLLASLGEGIRYFVSTPVGTSHVLLRTPSVRNVDLFPRLLPTARLIVLVRDARSVIDSGVRSFGWTYGWATRYWSEAARRVLAFDAVHRGAPWYRLIRYEDLVDDMESSVNDLLLFCGLDVERFDHEQARNLPLVGSSIFRGGSRAVHWQPVERPQQLPTHDRSSDWP